jgi:hypothetical protein
MVSPDIDGEVGVKKGAPEASIKNYQDADYTERPYTSFATGSRIA